MFCAVAACGLGIASAAQADSSWIGVDALASPQTPGWFVTPGAEIGVQRLPKWNSTNSLHSFHFPFVPNEPAISVFTPEPRLFGGEYGGTLGYALRDGALPPWLGQNVRIGVTGTYVSMGERTSAGGTLGPSFFTVADLQGRAVIGGLISTNTTIGENLRTHREGFDLNLRAASDFPLAPGWTFTPSVAVFGGRTVDTYNFDSALLLPGSGVAWMTNQIDERVRNWSLGGDVSGGLSWQATGALTLNLTGRAGVVWQRSQLDGTQCAVANGINCSFAPFFPALVSNAVANDSRSRVGFRGGAALNASLDMRFGILTVGGFFLYDSAVPGVQNPSQATLQIAGTNIGQTARIRFDDAFRYGGIVTLRVPLPGL